MDEVEGPRPRQSSEDSVSLVSSLAEPINLEGQLSHRLRFRTSERVHYSAHPLFTTHARVFCHADVHYAQLRGELEHIAQNLEAESWSVAVDQNYLKTLNKEAIKRQEVIYGRLGGCSCWVFCFSFRLLG